MHLSLSESLSLFLLCIYVGVKLLGLGVNSYLFSFSQIQPNSFPESFNQFTFPPDVQDFSIQLFYYLSNTWYSQSLILSVLVDESDSSDYSFSLHFSEDLFKCLLVISSLSNGDLASVSALPINIQHLFPLRLTDLIIQLSKGLSRSSSAPQFKSINSSVLRFYGPTLTYIHDYWKNHSFDYTFVGKGMSLVFNKLSRFVLVFLSRNQHLLISWLQSSTAVIS